MNSIEPELLGDYPARGGNQSLSLLGMISPDSIRSGTLLGENHQHKPSAMEIH
jgi:hypothetical protein